MTTASNPNTTTSAVLADSAQLEQESLADRAQVPAGPSSALTLQIESVRWGQTVNIGNYESVRLDAEAVVPMDGDPVSTLRELEQWIAEQLPDDQRTYETKVRSRSKLTEELRELEQKVAAARDVWQSAEAFITRLGLEIPNRTIEDLPF